jgi:hypothetical protein
MSIPGFSAGSALGSPTASYATASPSSRRRSTGPLRPQLIAPLPICRATSCLTVGSCKIRVSCCRSFTGGCHCQAIPCLVPLAQ